jgi:hypothetical protein
MIVIDPTLLGRKFYTVDAKTIYTVRGVVISGTILVIGEYLDSTGKISKLATHKLTDVKFTDSVLTTTNP